MYRFINPETPPELSLRMLFQPAGDGVFHRACEADGYRALVAALLDDPGYESAGVPERLQARIRAAEDLVLLSEVEGLRLHVTSRDEASGVNVHSDEEFIRSLERVGFVSMAAAGVDR